MNFIYLKGIYPLKEKINISSDLVIDNPKPGLECNLVLDFLKYQLLNHKTLDYTNDLEAKYNSELMNEAVKKLSQKFLKTELNVDKEKLKGEPIDVLSKCWLIARYDDGGLWNKYYKEVSEEIQGKKIRNYFQKKDAEILHEEMIDHLYFLTMPITDEITSYEKTIVMGKNEFSIQSVLLSVDSSYKYSFRTIIDRSKDIEIFSKNYESAKKVLGEKVKYISKILREISENASKINRIQLVMLVSIIEFLLTHDPSDGSEDSISKQFRLKTSILVKDYQGLPIDELGQRLKDIYNLRSKIAHGDFKEVEKCLKKFQSKQIYMCNLIDDLYIYITEILRVYLVEPNYIDYLKKS